MSRGVGVPGVSVQGVYVLGVSVRGVHVRGGYVLEWEGVGVICMCGSCVM